MSDKRIPWNQYFMLQAILLSMRSTCQRLSVGAILVRDRRIIAGGYNGAVSGDAHCIDVGCHLENNHCVKTIHAEMNALLQCAKFGIATDGAEVYVTDFPCLQCTKSLLQAGIKKIYYCRNYHNNDYALSLMELKGVAVEQVQINPNYLDTMMNSDLIKRAEDHH